MNTQGNGPGVAGGPINDAAQGAALGTASASGGTFVSDYCGSVVIGPGKNLLLTAAANQSGTGTAIMSFWEERPTYGGA